VSVSNSADRLPDQSTSPTSATADSASDSVLSVSPGRNISTWLHSRLPVYSPPIYRRRSYLHLGIFAVVMVVAGLIWKGDNYHLGLMTTSFIYAIAVIGLYFAYSLGGLFAFSQAGFMGVGAYTSARIASHHGFVLGFVAAIVVTFVVGIGLAFILRRARDLYFAVGALAFAELASLAFANWHTWTGVSSGQVYDIKPISLAGHNYTSGNQTYWFLAIVTGLVLLLSILVERSPLRREAIATKSIPMVARASGVPVVKVTVVLFAFGSALAGVAGSLQAHTLGALTPDTFAVGLAINLYLMLLLGGLRSIWGGVFGAIFYVWLPEFLRPVKEYETVIYSFLLLATIIVLPQGIAGSTVALTKKAVQRVKGR
jgi:branched-chain amino acid transport system permease protein